jgi:hypothetical protein
MDTITVARLVGALRRYFPGSRHIVGRLRESGLIAAGAPGRGGARSAQVDTRQAVLVLIALTASVTPIEAPAAARAIADFRLRRIEHPNKKIRDIDGLGSVRLIDVMVAQLDAIRGALPISRVIGWHITRSEARQRSPSRMVFSPVELPSNRNGREIVREMAIPAILLSEIAELFPRLPPREPETELERQLAAVLGMDIDALPEHIADELWLGKTGGRRKR